MLDAGSIKQKNKCKLSMVSLYLGLAWTPRFRDPGSHTRRECMGAESHPAGNRPSLISALSDLCFILYKEDLINILYFEILYNE